MLVEIDKLLDCDLNAGVLHDFVVRSFLVQQEILEHEFGPDILQPCVDLGDRHMVFSGNFQKIFSGGKLRNELGN